MIQSVGVDIADVKRMRAALERWGDRLVTRTFSPAEAAYCRRHRDAAVRFAARFAAKEAFIKCLGTGRGIAWNEIELVNRSSGKPEFRLSDRIRAKLARKRIDAVHVSVSHCPEYAVALVVFESAGPRGPGERN